MVNDIIGRIRFVLSLKWSSLLIYAFVEHYERTFFAMSYQVDQCNIRGYSISSL